MAHYRYKNRKQPENRQHLGELETHKESKTRLNKIKKDNEKLTELKREIKAQTGDEFYFGMQKKKEIKSYEKEIRFIDWETRRIKKKLNEKSRGVHIKFDEEVEEHKEESENETTVKLKGYLNELEDAKVVYKSLHTKK